MPDTLFSPDGIEVPADTPTEITRLKARGYTETRPFVPAEHTVEEVVQHVESNPDEASTVLAAERAGKNRKTVTGGE